MKDMHLYSGSKTDQHWVIITPRELPFPMTNAVCPAVLHTRLACPHITRPPPSFPDRALAFRLICPPFLLGCILLPSNCTMVPPLPSDTLLCSCCTQEAAGSAGAEHPNAVWHPLPLICRHRPAPSESSRCSPLF